MKEKLQKWQKYSEEIEENLKNAQIVFGADCFESPLFQTYFKLFESYTDELALNLEVEGEDEEYHKSWLHYYAYECEFGKNPMTVSINDETVELCGLDELIKIIKLDKLNDGDKKSEDDFTKTESKNNPFYMEPENPIVAVSPLGLLVRLNSLQVDSDFKSALKNLSSKDIFIINELISARVKDYSKKQWEYISKKIFNKNHSQLTVARLISENSSIMEEFVKIQKNLITKQLETRKKEKIK